MMHFSRSAAERSFAERPLSGQSTRVAQYWLSLWRGDALPVRADFKPRDMAEHLPNIALFDVVPEVSVRCRLQGSTLARGLGEDITGQDWLALTRPEDRALRLERWSSVARGAIGRGLRLGHRESGENQYAEELMLPFGDIAQDGSRQVLFHLAWRQTRYDPTRGGIENVNALSQEFHLTDLHT